MRKTEQIKFWEGKFGDDYVDRNSGSADECFSRNFGVTRREVNLEFLGGINKAIPILEVGCNIGNQLKVLGDMGFTDLTGLEINKKAIEIARKNKNFKIIEGSGLNIPFEDDSFGLVFTSGVLIHIAPKDLPRIIDEMYRVSKEYIWCFEYYSESCVNVEYRGYENRLWKDDFLKIFLERHPDLKLIKKRKLKYKENDNVDIMFLLKKQ